MFDFRLKVFYTVAQRLSFTKAAEELFITQPAVTKHIHELETQLGQTLIQRKGRDIALTAAGNILFDYSKKIFSIYQSLEFDLGQLKGKAEGVLRIGASTTIAQYILPKLLAIFLEKYPQIKASLITGNTETIEELLQQEKIDVGLIEGSSNKSFVNYIPFAEDELVLVTNYNNNAYPKNIIAPKAIKELPLIVREEGSGTLNILQHALQSKGIHFNDLNIILRLGSTEGIKQYLLHSNSYAFISIHACPEELQNKTLKVIEIKGIRIKRTLQFIHTHGQPNKMIELFIKNTSRQ